MKVGIKIAPTSESATYAATHVLRVETWQSRREEEIGANRYAGEYVDTNELNSADAESR
jgi:hypothetical protein